MTAEQAQRGKLPCYVNKSDKTLRARGQRQAKALLLPRSFFSLRNILVQSFT